MVNAPVIEKYFEKACFWLLMSTLVSLAFSVRFVTSLSVVLLILLVCIHPKRRLLIGTAFRDPLFISGLILFLLQVAGLFYTDDSKEAVKELTKKAGIFAIPFFFCSGWKISKKDLNKLVSGFSISLMLVSLYCVVWAIINYSNDANPSHFFYHELVRPIGHHAIFFSFFLFFCILYWMEEGIRQTNPTKRWLPILGVFSFVTLIMLLSSKVVIGILLFYLLVFGIKQIISKRSNWVLPVSFLLFTIIVSLLVLTENPVKKRFADLASGNADLFRQEKFSPDLYFNGLQFRLVTWRFTYEILQENNSWVTGVSPGDAQNALDKKYKETNIYLGDDGKSGFLGYNCHNVYFQTILESGLLGLFVLLCFMFFFIRSSLRKKNKLAFSFFMAMIFFGCTESLLSTQYAILLFLLLPLLALKTEQTEV